MVLNISFNENEPIVCRPGEALDCFLRTRMDLLVLGGRLVTRGRSIGGVGIADDRHVDGIVHSGHER